MAKKLVTVKLKNGRVMEVPEKIALMYERSGGQILDASKPVELGTKTIPREITQPKKLVIPGEKAPAEIKPAEVVKPDVYPGDKPAETEPKDAPDAKVTEKAPAKPRRKPKK